MLALPFLAFASCTTYATGINTIDCGSVGEGSQCERTVENLVAVGLSVEAALVALFLGLALLPWARGKRRFAIPIPFVSAIVALVIWNASSQAVSG